MAEDRMFDAFAGDAHDGDTLPACRVPLDRVRLAVKGKAFAKYFDVDDMMYMFSARVDGFPPLHHYKHRDTRGYLIVDDDGTTYQWTEPDDWGDHYEKLGTFTVLPSLVEALDGLHLFELPWMKVGLEAERRGLTWDERSQHPAAKAWSRRRWKTVLEQTVGPSD
jgi:hypothetical protein